MSADQCDAVGRFKRAHKVTLRSVQPSLNKSGGCLMQKTRVVLSKAQARQTLIQLLWVITPEYIL